jgi:hypothetical protein
MPDQAAKVAAIETRKINFDEGLSDADRIEELEGAVRTVQPGSPNRLSSGSSANSCTVSTLLAIKPLARNRSSALQHQQNSLQVSQTFNVTQRIAVEQNKIGTLAWLNSAYFMLQFHSLCRDSGAGAQRLHGEKARPNQIHKFSRVAPVGITISDVASSGDRNTSSVSTS